MNRVHFAHNAPPPPYLDPPPPLFYPIIPIPPRPNGELLLIALGRRSLGRSVGLHSATQEEEEDTTTMMFLISSECAHCEGHADAAPHEEGEEEEEAAKPQLQILSPLRCHVPQNEMEGMECSMERGREGRGVPQPPPPRHRI